MMKYNIKNFKNGWIVGDFVPTLISTKNFEVAIKHYKSGQKESSHCHKIADEITIIITGSVLMNNTPYEANDVILINKNEYTDFIPLTDCITCVIKAPSAIGDKYEKEKTDSTPR